MPSIKNFKNLDRVFTIAEIGGAHEGNVDRAISMIHQAKNAGADAVKFQAYNPSYLVNHEQDKNRFNHFNKFSLSLGNYQMLAETAISNGIEFMCSVWDEHCLEALDPFINIHKVGSGDLTNYPLLKKIAETNKPIILSTAMANPMEILDAIGFIGKVNSKILDEDKLCIMHCVAMYGDPRPEYANLGAINELKNRFGSVHIGYSDHTMGSFACEIAVALGCRVIEKHFTDDENSGSFRDNELSLEEDDFSLMIENFNYTLWYMGNGRKVPITEIETPDRIKEFRRAVYPITNIKKGQVVRECDIDTLRPCIGIPANEYYNVLGKKAKRDIEPFSVLDRWDFK